MNLNELEDALQQINGQLMTDKEMQYVYHVSYFSLLVDCNAFFTQKNTLLKGRCPEQNHQGDVNLLSGFYLLSFKINVFWKFNCLRFRFWTFRVAEESMLNCSV